MSDRPEPRAKSPGVTLVAAVLVVVFLVLPMLYVLSIGPVAWLIDHEYLSENVGYIYVPLSLVARICTPIGDMIRSYTDWWVG